MKKYYCVMHDRTQRCPHKHKTFALAEKCADKMIVERFRELSLSLPELVDEIDKFQIHHYLYDPDQKKWLGSQVAGEVD
jgi:hypothetical protein